MDPLADILVIDHALEINIRTDDSLFLGRLSTLDQVATALAQSWKLIALHSHGDGLDSPLGNQAILCSKKKALHPNRRGMNGCAPCQELGRCHRLNGMPMNEALRDSRLVDPRILRADIVLYDTCFAANGGKGHRHGLPIFAQLASSRTVGAVVAAEGVTFHTRMLNARVRSHFMRGGRLSDAMDALRSSDAVKRFGTRFLVAGDTSVLCPIASARTRGIDQFHAPDSAENLAHKAASPNGPARRPFRPFLPLRARSRPARHPLLIEESRLGDHPWWTADAWLKSTTTFSFAGSRRCLTCRRMGKLYRTQDRVRRYFVTCTECGISYQGHTLPRRAALNLTAAFRSPVSAGPAGKGRGVSSFIALRGFRHNGERVWLFDAFRTGAGRRNWTVRANGLKLVTEVFNMTIENRDVRIFGTRGQWKALRLPSSRSVLHSLR